MSDPPNRGLRSPLSARTPSGTTPSNPGLGQLHSCARGRQRFPPGCTSGAAQAPMSDTPTKLDSHAAPSAQGPCEYHPYRLWIWKAFYPDAPLPVRSSGFPRCSDSAPSFGLRIQSTGVRAPKPVSIHVRKS